MPVIGEATLDVRADTNPAEKAIGSFSKRAGKSFTSVGKSLTLGLTAPLLLMGKKAVDAFNEAEAAIATTQAVLKSTGQQANITAKGVTTLVDSLAKITTFEDDVIRQSSNLLLTFTKVRNEVGEGNQVFDEAQLAILNFATAMNKGVSAGADLEGATIQIGKALNDPIKGLTALGKAGVTFSVEQKALIKELVKGGDVLGAQKVILAELGTEFDGIAEKFAGTDYGKQIQAQKELGEAFEELGGAIAPLVTDLLGKLAGFATKLADAFGKLSPGTQDIVVKLGALALILGPMLIVVGKLASAYSALRIAFAGAGVAATVAAPQMAAAASATTAVGAAAPAAAAGLGLFGTALAGLGLGAAVVGIDLLLAKLGFARGTVEAEAARIAEIVAKKPVLDLDDKPFLDKLQNAGNSLLETTAKSATPKIDADKVPFDNKTEIIDKDLRDLIARENRITIDVDDQASGPIATIAQRLANLPRRIQTVVSILEQATMHGGGVVMHKGGIVPPRLHSGTLNNLGGGLAGKLRNDERVAVLQVGELVLSKKQVAQAKAGVSAGGNNTFNIYEVGDAQATAERIVNRLAVG